MVQLQGKKYTAGTSVGTPIPCPVQPGVCKRWDSDKDGCPDSLELQGPVQTPNPQKNGGLRDPFNKYDYFDPTGDRAISSADISAVVNKFGQNEWKKDLTSVATNGVVPNPLYNPNMDRTKVPGGADWNLGPPNGVVSSEDILAAVKSFNQWCPHS